MCDRCDCPRAGAIARSRSSEEAAEAKLRANLMTGDEEDRRASLRRVRTNN